MIVSALELSTSHIKKSTINYLDDMTVYNNGTNPLSMISLHSITQTEAMNMLRFDDYDMEMVADILVKTNKSITDVNGMNMNKDELIEFMKSMAYQHLSEKGTTMSTGGFLLTAFEGSNGERNIRVSLTPYNMQKYITSVENKIKNILAPV